jgi:polysaccharide biosynthesis protein PslG
MNNSICLLVAGAVFISCVYAGTPLPELGVPASVGVNLKTHNFTIEVLDRVHEAGFKFVRRGMYWNVIERQKGVYYFSSYDPIMEHARSLGITVNVVLFSSNPAYEHKGVGGVVTEAGRQGFARFAAAAAAHYKDHAIIWEIWNEPNTRTFWRKEGKGNSDAFAQEYTDLVKAVMPAMREADPDCFVAAGSLSNYWGPSYEWTEFCFKNGILKTGIDAWSVHPYGVKTPEEFTVGHDIMRALLKKYGAPDMPLINTERGFAVKETYEGWSGGSQERALEFQGWHFVRQFMMDQLNGVRGTVWYEWDGDEFGLVERRSGEKRPSYHAAREMISQLNGYTLKSRLETDSDLDYVLEWTDSAGNRKLVAWTAPPAGGAPDEFIPHDLVIPVTGGSGETLTLAITGEPQYIAIPKGLVLGKGIAGPGKALPKRAMARQEGEVVNLRLFDPGSMWTFERNTGDGRFFLESKGLGVIAYNFEAESAARGRYVLARAPLELPEGTLELHVNVRSPIAQQITLRIVDRTGQTHQIKKRISGTGDWEQILMPLNRRMEHWGGAKDAKVHFPVKQLVLVVPLPAEDHKVGTVEFTEVSAVMAAGATPPRTGTQ